MYYVECYCLGNLPSLVVVYASAFPLCKIKFMHNAVANRPFLPLSVYLWLTSVGGFRGVLFARESRLAKLNLSSWVRGNGLLMCCIYKLKQSIKTI